IANLCRELIDLENLLILTEKSSLDAFSAITRTQDETPQPRYLRTQRKLTARELQVLELIIACNNNKRIASLLNIDHKTVHSHRIHIMKKLGMNSSQVMHKQIVNM
ncbi:TPA: LuxR family transcriptional regulator, partial [Klebsiella pneumoniae]|nr:LuxR family transcriptional regulator [Klebsiella pneumoniae]